MGKEPPTHSQPWTCDVQGCSATATTSGPVPDDWAEVIEKVVSDAAVTIGDRTGGTFTLTYEGQTTGNIAFDATPADIETELELLTKIADVSVVGTGSPTDPWVVTFVDPLGSVAGPSMDGSLLTGGSGGEGVTVRIRTQVVRYRDPTHAMTWS